jgi:alpha-1,6-mannosyltransferase
MRPDRVEVSDKLSLAWVADWATDAGVPSLLLSHERLDAILASRVPRWFPLARCADRRNRGLARRFGRVVCTSGFSAAEFDRLGAANITRVPLGVDLDVFAQHGAHRASKRTELLYLGRLSKEKRPELAVAALRALVAGGADAHLTLAGAGPLANDLAEDAAGLPVTFLGHVHGRPAVASLLRRADVVLAPCPAETFGLAVLEALACGTPVVTSDQGGAQELIDEGCGRVASSDPAAWADAVEATTQLPDAGRRARTRAESYPWSRTVAGMLRAHDLAEVASCA